MTHIMRIDEYLPGWGNGEYPYTYKGYLELSDRKILDELSFAVTDDLDALVQYGGLTNDEYNSQFVDKYIKKFEQRFGTEIHCLGSCGRHVCVEYNDRNEKRYESMRKYVETLQDQMIRELERYYNKLKKECADKVTVSESALQRSKRG